MSGQQAIDGVWSPKGYQQLTSLSSSTALTVPQGARVAVIVAESQGIRIRSDGTAPTSSVGIPLAKDTPYLWNTELGSFRVIEQAASAKLNVSYLGD